MEKFIQKSVFSGIVFSTIQELGPEPIYMFPGGEEGVHETGSRLSYLDYIQISIKSLSLIIDDKILVEKEKFKGMRHFAIIPFPDFKLMAIAFFHFINRIKDEFLIPSTITLFLDEKNRNFLYNNNNRIKLLIETFSNQLDLKLQDGIKKKEEISPLFESLFSQLLEMEKVPLMKIAQPRKLKFLFAGLDNSGKTSFLLALDKKFSKLIGLKPTLGASITTLETFGGTTMFLWDLGGQQRSREGYLKKPHIYLYETDILFYFIDIQDHARFNQSILYLNEIINKISEEFVQKPPILFILSKADPDILRTKEIDQNIKRIKSRLIEACRLECEPEIYLTSIFSLFSILRAFSSGISKLSPYREKIQSNLKEFSTKSGISISLLLNIDGLVLADYYSEKAKKKFWHQLNSGEELLSQELRNVWEFTAPQFAIIWKIFSEFKTLKKDEAVFKIAEFIILVKGIQIAESPMFLMCLMDDENEKGKIKGYLPEFIEKTADLLIKYLN